MRLDQWSRVAKSIRFQINLADGNFDPDPELIMEDSCPDTLKTRGTFKLGHIILGAAQKTTTLKDVSASHLDDPAFLRFQSKFQQFLQDGITPPFSDNDLKNICDANSEVSLPIFQFVQNCVFIVFSDT